MGTFDIRVSILNTLKINPRPSKLILTVFGDTRTPREREENGTALEQLHETKFSFIPQMKQTRHALPR